MKRLVLVLVLLAGCGAGAAHSGFEPPKGAEQVEPGVWKFEKMLYGTDCARLRELTKEGQPYGPSPRRADGSYDVGYGYVCP